MTCIKPKKTGIDTMINFISGKDRFWHIAGDDDTGLNLIS
jgi:hypothetical protein